MPFAFLPDWHDLLPREGGHLIAVGGFGGKSALIEAMAGVYAADAVPVAVSAAGFDAPLPAVDWADLEAGAAAPPAFRVVRDGAPLDAAGLDALGGLLPGHVVLAEIGAGDPAPLDADAPPVWPERTSLAVVACGLGSVDRARAALDPDGRLPADHFTATDRGELWSWTGLERWLAERALPALPPAAPRVVALLQLDACDDAVGLFAATGRVMEELDVPVVLVGDTSGPEPRLRTAFRLDEA